MKYNYQPILTSIGRDGKFFWMPEVVTAISGNHGSRRILALVDSGAPVCVADIAIAESIGAVLDKTNPLHIGGVVGEGYGEPAYPADIKIKVEGLKEVSAHVYFGKISKAFTLILGQKGFFDTHRITFEKHRDTFEITAVRRKK